MLIDRHVTNTSTHFYICQSRPQYHIADYPSICTYANKPPTKAPSPMSAVLTVSLEGYLDGKRLSYGSPPNSDLTVDSFPVFSPSPSMRRNAGNVSPNVNVRPPVTNTTDSSTTSTATTATITIPGTTPLLTLSAQHLLASTLLISPTTSASSITATTTTTNSSSAAIATAFHHQQQKDQQQHTLQPHGSVQMRQHRRQSSINTVSWTDQNGDSSSLRPLSYNLDPSDVRSLPFSFRLFVTFCRNYTRD